MENKRFAIILFLLCGVICLAAHPLMRDIFLNARQSVFPYLNQTMRTAMVESYEKGDTVSVENAMHGKSRIAFMDDSFMEIIMNGSLTTQIKCITTDSDSIFYAVVNTYSLPQKQSNVTIYDEEWNVFVGSQRLQPAVEQLTVHPENMSEETFLQLKKQLFPLLLSAEIKPNADVISFVPTITFSSLATDELESIIVSKEYSLHQIVKNKGLY